MKKITLSVAALSLAISSFGQPNDSTYVSQEASYAEKLHKNLYSVVINAEDMLFQIKQDEDSGFILDGMGEFYEELLKEIIKLTVTIDLNDRRDYEYSLDCENCDEVD